MLIVYKLEDNFKNECHTFIKKQAKNSFFSTHIMKLI